MSPDLLHFKLYSVRTPDGEPFREFLRRLRWVVVDESHTYVGSFGAHFTNLMRRLRLAVDKCGGDSDKVQFICSSATIGNPSEMALRFSGRVPTPERLHLIEKSGARHAERTFLCLKPSSQTNVDAARIVLSLLHKELRGICFCNSRYAVKSLLSLIKQEARRQGCSHLAEGVAIFYGSLKHDRRNNIIEQLKSGRVQCILSTSALEAGMDLPGLDWCLVRGYPGSLMSFRQRVGRAGRGQKPGLVIFLPIGQSHLDSYYSRNPDLLLHGTAESASFNPDYPAILGKHLMAGAVESGIPIRDLTQYFGQRAGAIADTLMSQNQIHLNRDGLLWARGNPHKGIALRGHAAAAVKLIDSHTGEEFEEMSLDMAHRELFPGAVYSAQDGNGELVKYRSTELNVNERRAILTPVDSKTTTFTIAETDLDVRLLEALAEPKTVALLVSNGELEPMLEGLELVLGWGQVTSSVTGYRSCVREYAQTCTSSGCRNYNRPLTGKLCSACGRRLQYAELTTVIDTVEFEKPYRTQYETPIVKVTAPETARASVEHAVQQLKAEVLKKNDGNIPPGYAALWEASATSIAMHSLGHQIIFAVPLVVLSSSLDLNYLVEEEGGTVGYFYDSCADGNGSSEAIFHQFLRFAEAAASLARACSCEAGCPKCLYQHSCPQANEALNKQVGLTLLEAVSAAANKTTATD